MSHPGEIAYGIALAVIGMIVFNLGLSSWLSCWADNQVMVPAAFTTIRGVEDSPLATTLD